MVINFLFSFFVYYLQEEINDLNFKKINFSFNKQEKKKKKNKLEELHTHFYSYVFLYIFKFTIKQTLSETTHKWNGKRRKR